MGRRALLGQGGAPGGPAPLGRGVPGPPQVAARRTARCAPRPRVRPACTMARPSVSSAARALWNPP